MCISIAKKIEKNYGERQTPSTPLPVPHSHPFSCAKKAQEAAIYAREIQVKLLSLIVNT